MKKSINEWMVIRKVLSERRGDLKQLRQISAIEKTTIRRYGEDLTEEKLDAKYDTKLLDRRITEMQNADLLIDSAIKQSNAMIGVELPLDVERLLSPME
jgi:hypothetical protein